MEIDRIESFPVEIPLEEPVSFSNRTLTYRDHAITYVRTKSGHEGVGYSLGYEGAGLIADAVESLLEPIVVGEDPRDTERLWREMFDGTVQIGRSGILLRAISTVDIALWDIKAKAADQPLYKLLGGHADSVPAYASGGYYRDEKGHDALRDEMRRYLDEGHDVVKMKLAAVRSPRKPTVLRPFATRSAPIERCYSMPTVPGRARRTRSGRVARSNRTTRTSSRNPSWSIASVR